MRSLWLLALLPSLVFAQVLAPVGVPTTGGTFSGPITAPSFTATVASGTNGLACQQNGCRFDFGAGASDYASSNGTTVTFAGPLETSSTVTANGATSTGTIQTKGLVSTALDTPVNATFTAGTGSLPNATYYARVSACNEAGCTVPSTETSLAITTGGINYNWGAVTGSTSYKVYCRTTGAEQLCATVTAPTTTWLDTGSVTPSGAMPTLGTSGNISTVSGVTARDFTSTAASGSVAMSIVSGSKDCMDGPTCSVYWYNSGGNMRTASVLQVNSILTIDLSRSADGGISIKTGDISDGDATSTTFNTSIPLTTAGDRLITGKNNGVLTWGVSFAGTYTVDGTDASGTPGAATINQPAGQVAIDDTASSVVVTNSLVSTSSIVIPVLQFVDATCTQILSCVPAAGSFTITMNAACTAHTKIGFVLNNYF